MANEIIGLINKTTDAGITDANVQYLQKGTEGSPINETLYGVKTFGSFPVTPSSAPSGNYDVANKKYVDDSVVVSTTNFGKVLSTDDNTLQEISQRINDHQHSFGSLSIGKITDNLDGTITISQSDVILNTATDWSGLTIKATIAQTNLTPTNNQTSYLVADYNNGSPLFRIESLSNNINGSSIILIANIYRVDNIIHILEVNWAQATSTRINNRLINQQRFVRTSGLTISEYGTRNFQVSLGLVYYGIRYFSLGLTNSVDNYCDFYYHTSGAWTSLSGVTTYNNTQYDNGSNLQLLANEGPNNGTWTRDTTTITVTFNNHGLLDNDGITVTAVSDTRPIPLGIYTITKIDENTFSFTGINKGDSSGTLTYTTDQRYAVNWIYRMVEDGGNHKLHLAYTIGSGNYKITEAMNSLPSTPPAILSRNAILVGRIITKRGQNTAYQIDSAFVTTFETQPVKDHNDLGGLQGGLNNEFYHLPTIQYNNLTLLTPTQSTSISSNITGFNVKFTGSTESQNLTLPEGKDGMTINIRNASSVLVNILRNDSDTIEGEISLTLNVGESIKLVYIGTDWTLF